MNNKELIERLRLLIKNGRYYTKEQARIDISDAVNALQDAEADAKKQAAIHLHEEAKLLEEINGLKADLEYHVHNRNQLTKQLADAWNKINELKEDSRLRAVGDSQEINKENDRLKAKLSSQVDPIELIEFTANKYGFKLEIGKSIAEKVFEHFKKERELHKRNG